MAAKVLCGYRAELPDGEFQAADASGKKVWSAEKRGEVTLCSYVHSEGARQAVKDIEVRPKVDFEVFATKMGRKRGWSRQKWLGWWSAVEKGDRGEGAQGQEGPA